MMSDDDVILSGDEPLRWIFQKIHSHLLSRHKSGFVFDQWILFKSLDIDDSKVIVEDLISPPQDAKLILPGESLSAESPDELPPYNTVRRFIVFKDKIPLSEEDRDTINHRIFTFNEKYGFFEAEDLKRGILKLFDSIMLARIKKVDGNVVEVSEPIRAGIFFSEEEALSLAKEYETETLKKREEDLKKEVETNPPPEVPICAAQDDLLLVIDSSIDRVDKTCPCEHDIPSVECFVAIQETKASINTLSQISKVWI